MKIPRLALTEKTITSDLWSNFISRYGETRTKSLFHALSKPVRNFALRATITKFSREDVMEKFESFGWDVSIDKSLSEMFTVKTKGAFPIPYDTSIPRIVADKVAAESVFIGSDLFGVGIKKVPKLSSNSEVAIISERNQIVAQGISLVDSKIPKVSGIAVKNTHSFFKVPSLRNLGVLETGEAYSQSIPAAYVAHVLNPQKGETIVDLCAAPGGKSTNAAILSNNEARIISFDRSAKRLAKMRAIVKAQKLKSIEIIEANSIDYLKTHTLKADKVIVDPSCTAIGVRPKIYENTTKADITNSATYQKSFLWVAAQVVRKGGIVTYSTCTLEPEENEKVIQHAVENLGLKLCEPDLLLGTKGEDTNDGLDLESMRRFYPDIHDTPGFFIAKLQK